MAKPIKAAVIDSFALPVASLSPPLKIHLIPPITKKIKAAIKATKSNAFKAEEIIPASPNGAEQSAVFPPKIVGQILTAVFMSSPPSSLSSTFFLC